MGGGAGARKTVALEEPGRGAPGAAADVFGGPGYFHSVAMRPRMAATCSAEAPWSAAIR